MSNNIVVGVEEGFDAPAWLDSVAPFVQKILDRLGIENWELSVLFCSDAFIAGLNSQYRNIDAPTDVLSFEQGDEYVDESDVQWFCAGDIVISVAMIHKNAAEFGVSPNEELKRLLIHGVLHLDGMDHETNDPDQEMLQLQERILSGFPDELIL